MKTLKQEWREDCLKDNKNRKGIKGTDVGCLTIIPLSVIKKYNAISGDDGSWVTNDYFKGRYQISYQTHYNDKLTTKELSLKGECFFGDPCQCIPDDRWSEFCDNELDNPKTKVIIFRTGGDGGFEFRVNQI